MSKQHTPKRRLISTAAASITAASLLTVAPAHAEMELSPGYEPRPDNPTCLFNLCGDAWGLGFALLAVSPRQREFMDNGGKTGITAGSVKDSVQGLGMSKDSKLFDMAALGSKTKNFFTAPDEVGKAFDAQIEAYAEKHNLSAAKVKAAKTEFRDWGNFVKGAEVFGASHANAKRFAEMRRPFLDRVSHAGVDQALKELFEALDIYKKGGTPSYGPLAIGSDLPDGSIGSSKGFHPADKIGGLAGGSSGMSGSS